MKLFLFLTQILLFFNLSEQSKSALLIIDVQNCYLRNGSVAISESEQIIPVINSIRNKFDIVIFTQDWHCKDHISFASVHPE